MRLNRQPTQAFTTLQLIVVLSVCALLVVCAIAFVRQQPFKAKAVRITCVLNLKQLGSAYTMFSSDNNGLYPADLSSTQTNQGWHDFVNLTNAGEHCWKVYTILSHELDLPPKVLTCPADIRKPATDFDHFKNINTSYFVSPSANKNFPLSILGGDRNLAPSTTPKNDFGFSPKDGNGNDIILQTNSAVCWSLKMHSAGSAIGAGNILMGDGSVQQCSSARLMSDYTINAATPSNFPTAFDNSKSNSFRLIFP
jgi:hypothetical protein